MYRRDYFSNGTKPLVNTRQVTCKPIVQSLITLSAMLLSGLLTQPLLANEAEQKGLDIAPFVAEYTVTTNALPLSGTGSRSLKHLGGGQYRMEQVAKSFALTRREISEFSMNNCQLSPLSYRYEQSGIGRDRRHLLDFNPEENLVVYESKKNKADITLPTTTTYYDRLSETLALQCSLFQRKATTANINDTITLHVVDKGSLREHTFAIVGEETLKIAQTEMHTIKVTRVRDGGERETTMWFAPRQSYALVKMQQNNKGKTLTFGLQSIKQVF